MSLERILWLVALWNIYIYQNSPTFNHISSYRPKSKQRSHDVETGYWKCVLRPAHHLLHVACAPLQQRAPPHNSVITYSLQNNKNKIPKRIQMIIFYLTNLYKCNRYRGDARATRTTAAGSTARTRMANAISTMLGTDQDRGVYLTLEMRSRRAILENLVCIKEWLTSSWTRKTPWNSSQDLATSNTAR